MQYILDAAPEGTRAVIAAHDGIDLLTDAMRRSDGPPVLDVGDTASLGETRRDGAGDDPATG